MPTQRIFLKIATNTKVNNLATKVYLVWHFSWFQMTWQVILGISYLCLIPAIVCVDGVSYHKISRSQYKQDIKYFFLSKWSVVEKQVGQPCYILSIYAYSVQDNFFEFFMQTYKSCLMIDLYLSKVFLFSFFYCFPYFYCWNII